MMCRIIFCGCGLLSLGTAVPYAMLRGVGLPFQSEWVIFVGALGLLGLFGVTIALLPKTWIAKLCGKMPEDKGLFSGPLKVLGGCALISYLIAVFAYLAPSAWILNPHIMLALCPMYLVKMTFDPSPVLVFFLLAPLNAAVYGSLGLLLGYAWLALCVGTTHSTHEHFGTRVI